MKEIGVAVISLAPVLWLVVALVVWKLPGYKACFGGLLLSGILAVLVWKEPLVHMFSAVLEGVTFALFPIALIITGAVFLYNVVVDTGAMDTIQGGITHISTDKRMIVLLVGWCFGGFMEGIAGFGTAVAIPATMLVALGFTPMEATVSSLLANSIPTLFGSLGIPTVTLASITGLDDKTLSLVSVLLSGVLLMAIPFMMILVVSNNRLSSLKGVGKIALLSGGSYFLVQLPVAYFLGPELVVLVGSLASLGGTIVGIKHWEKQVPQEYEIATSLGKKPIAKETLHAWFPFFLVFLLLLLTSDLVAPIHNLVNTLTTSLQVYQGANPNTLFFSWGSTPGILVIIAGFFGGIFQGASLLRMGKILRDSFVQMRKTICTLLCVLATAKVMSYSGMIDSLGAVVVAGTGILYPLVSPCIGFVGGFVTGSGTSTGALFGSIQTQAAQKLGVSPYPFAAMNTIGACIGKTISPQTISIGTTTAGISGKEGEVFQGVLQWTLAMLLVASLLSMAIFLLMGSS